MPTLSFASISTNMGQFLVIYKSETGWNRAKFYVAQVGARQAGLGRADLGQNDM